MALLAPDPRRIADPPAQPQATDRVPDALASGTPEPLRRDLADGELRLTVHAAIGAVQSTLFFHSGLAPERQAALLSDIAHAGLGVAPAEVNGS